MATNSGIPAGIIPQAEEPGKNQAMESQKIEHDWVSTHTDIYTHTYLRHMKNIIDTIFST